jgi:hypothetical protein
MSASRSGVDRARVSRGKKLYNHSTRCYSPANPPALQSRSLTLISLLAMSSSAPTYQAPPKPWESSGNNNNAEAGPSHTTAFDQVNGNTTTVTTDRAPDLPERPGDMSMNGAQRIRIASAGWVGSTADGWTGPRRHRVQPEQLDDGSVFLCISVEPHLERVWWRVWRC